MTISEARTMLVYGATGKAGRLVVECALMQGWAVTAFVRNPIQHGSVSYVDVAEALVLLASDQERTWERKALFSNYATGGVRRRLTSSVTGLVPPPGRPSKLGTEGQVNRHKDHPPVS